MYIKESGIFRFAEELRNHHNLVFLDEVSSDNREMIRKSGYSLKGKTVAIRGDFQRKPRRRSWLSWAYMESLTTTTLREHLVEWNL
ncbi:hypothetical protein GQ600_16294 [Phytophthora cactorum]|nr:hypothetical protein GQ600_16294 [Phytophthora cactorum]